MAVQNDAALIQAYILEQLKNNAPQAYPSGPLNTTEREIRIVRLLSGDSSDALRCELETLSLDLFTGSRCTASSFARPSRLPRRGNATCLSNRRLRKVHLADLENTRKRFKGDMRRPATKAEQKRYATGPFNVTYDMGYQETVKEREVYQAQLWAAEARELRRAMRRRGKGDRELCPANDLSDSSDCELSLVSWRDEKFLDPFRHEPYVLDCTCQQTPCRCYEALSYTWGSLSEARTVLLHGGCEFAVSNNLYRVLHRLRKRNRARRLWIDALCINQGDISERNDQVARMGDVYSSAGRVIIWLGDASKARQVAQQRYATVQWDAFRTAEVPAMQDWHLRSLGAAFSETEPQWWQRAWVVQEFARASDWPDVCFGQFEVSWFYFAMWMNKVHRTESRPAFWPSGFQFDRLRDVRNMYHDRERSCSLLALMDGAFHTKAGDARDKVYSLRSLLSEAEQAAIRPDYHKDAKVVFAEATLQLLRSARSLAPL